MGETTHKGLKGEVRIEDGYKVAFRFLIDGNDVGHGFLALDPAENVRDVWVHESLRCRGIATLVMRCMMEEARARGVRRLTVVTDVNNVAARALYAWLGFEETEEIVHPEVGQAVRLEKPL